MTGLITDHCIVAEIQHFHISVEDKETRITLYPDGSLSVCHMNAVARRQRLPMGRTFTNVEEAMAAFRSPNVRTAIVVATSSAKDFARASGL